MNEHTAARSLRRESEPAEWQRQRSTDSPPVSPQDERSIITELLRQSPDAPDSAIEGDVAREGTKVEPGTRSFDQQRRERESITELLRVKEPYLGPETETESYTVVAELRKIEALRPDEWRRLSLEQRGKALQEAHRVIARAYGFAPGVVQVKELPGKMNGQWLAGGIEINRALVADDDPEKALTTLAHESRHAYQANAIQRPVSALPAERQQEIKMWRENFSQYLDPERFGLVRYRHQAIEVDAREFAKDIVHRLYGGKP